ncbi:MAG: hypothetical protein R6U68_11255, partial [Desulfobacteraceae bacterium]
LEMRPVDPKKYVPRFSSELELSEEVRARPWQRSQKCSAWRAICRGCWPTWPKCCTALTHS